MINYGTIDETQRRIENHGTLFNFGTITGNVVYNAPLTGVQYLDETGTERVLEEKYTIINSQTAPTAWSDGWYVVGGDVSIPSRVTVSGNVKLILKNNANLTVNGGIEVSGNNSFTVYAQSIGDSMGSLSATGADNQAGIGGGNDEACGTIVINGGTVAAQGGRYAMGLGGSTAETGGMITINGGNITATGGDGYSYGWTNTPGGPGIAVGQSGTVTINNGNVSATGGNGAQDVFTAAGGVVNAQPGSWESIGISGSFSTGPNGNGVIITQNFDNLENSEQWNGLFFIENTVGALDKGIIYGQTVTPTCDFTVPSGVTLTIEEGQNLVASQGVTMENGGTIVNNGTITNQGSIKNNGDIRVGSSGNYDGDQPTGNTVTYQIDWDTDGDGEVEDTTYVEAGEKPEHDPGSKDSTVAIEYIFTGWDPQITEATAPAQYKALFTETARRYTVELPEDPVGYTIKSGSTTVGYNSDFEFQVVIADGYDGTDLVLMANTETLQAGADNIYRVPVTGETRITVTGVKDITAPQDITVSYGKDKFKEFLNEITFGLFFKDNVIVTISATDKGSGVEEFTYRLGEDGELQTVKADGEGKATFTITEEFIGNIKDVSAKDKDGNLSSNIDYEYFAVEKTLLRV